MDKNSMNPADRSRAGTQAPRGDTVSHGKLIKRAEAARMLGVSVSPLRRKEGVELKTIVDADGTHMFDESEVRSVTVAVRRRQSVQALGTSIGDVAADVFGLLDAGEHPVEIVKRLRVAPDVVIGLQEQWVAMRGGFVVTSEQATALGRLGRAPVAKTGTALLAQIRHRVEVLTRMREGSAECSVCSDRTASICEPCVLVTNGPLVCRDIRIERREGPSKMQEIRVCVSANRAEPDCGDGTVAQLSSNWFPECEVDDSEVSDLVTMLD